MISFADAGPDRPHRARVHAVMIGGCAAIIAVMLWLGALHAQRAQLERADRAEALSAGHLVSARAEAILASLIRYDRRWTGDCRVACERDLRALLNDYPEIVSIGWVGAPGSALFRRVASGVRELQDDADARRLQVEIDRGGHAFAAGKGTFAFADSAGLILGRKDGRRTIAARIDPRRMLALSLVNVDRPADFRLQGRPLTSRLDSVVPKISAAFSVRESSWTVTVDATPVLDSARAVLLLAGLLVAAMLATTFLLLTVGAQRLATIHDLNRTLEQRTAEAQIDLSALITALPQLIWRCDAEGTCEYLSPQWAAYTGIPAEQQLGLRWLAQVHPDDMASTREQWANAVANNTPLDIEFRIRRHDGAYRWFATRGGRVTDPALGIDKWFGTNTDIQTLKDAEADAMRLSLALRDRALAAAQLASIVEFSDDAIMSKDMRGIITTWNAAAESMFGYSAAEIVGQSVRRIIPLDRQAEEDQLLSEIHEGRHVRAYQTIRRHKSGAPISVSVSIAPIRDPDGAICGAAKIVRDVGELEHRVEVRTAELRDANHQLRKITTLMETAQALSKVGSWEFDLRTGDVRWSHELFDMFGIEVAEIAPTLAAQEQLYEWESWCRLQAAVAHSLATGEGYELSLIGREVGGRQLRALAHGEVVFDAAGAMSHIVGTLQDVTQAQRDAERLQELSDRLQLATSAASIGVWDWDVNSNTIVWDDTMHAIYGIDPSQRQVPYEVWKRALHPDDLGRTERALQNAVAGTAEYKPLFRIVRPDGALRFIRAAATTVRNEAGKAVRVIGVNWDVTEPHQAELALRESEARLEEETRRANDANLAKSGFLANMSHELRTPLNSIIGFSNVMLKNKTRNLRPVDLAHLTRIASNGQHLLGLINGVLDLSKIEAGEMDVEMSWIDVQVLVRDTLAGMATQAAALDVRLLAEIPVDVQPLYADATRVKQIIINLVNNAVKFTKGGSVTVRVVLDARTRRPARFDVIDTGIGIPADRLQAVFEAFKQADASTTRQYGGTGLGLTISKSLAGLMGWDIEVESEVGVGSTFKLVVKGADAYENLERAPDIRPGVRAAVLRTETPDRAFLVLIIDDEADARELLQHEFQELNCAVVTACSAQDGLQLARTMKPDLITLDVNMPLQSGWDALRAFKEDKAVCDIPVVIVSVVARDGRVSEPGALEYIDKPISREKLAHLIPTNTSRAHARRIVLAQDTDGGRESETLGPLIVNLRAKSSA